MEIPAKKTDNQIDLQKFFIEIQQKSLWELWNLFAKGMAFYLAIIAVLMGYVITKNLPENSKALLLKICIGITIPFLIASAFSIWTLFKSADRLSEKIESLSTVIIQIENTGNFYTKLKWLIVIVAVSSGSVGAILLTCMFFMLNQS
jgi:hypothetical protein